MMHEIVASARKKMNDILGAIESHTGGKVSFVRPDKDTWILDLPSTRVHMRVNGPWLTIASELMDDVKGKNEAQLLRELMELNARTNGLKFGLEQGKFTINTEQPAAEISFKNIVDNLVLHHQGYNREFPGLLGRASELGLKWSDRYKTR